MSHYIKKIGATGELTEIVMGNHLKLYNLSQKSFHSWKIEDSEEGNTIEFICPQTKNGNELERSAFYQVFAATDKVNPIAVFELTDIQYDFLVKEAFAWKCTGKTWRDASSRIIISLKESRVSFKDLCKKILSQFNYAHYAFSLDDSFIEEHEPFEERYGRGYRVRAYASAVLEDLKNLGYRIWFDANLKMHAYHESTESIREINYDSDCRIHDKKITTQYADLPAGRIIVKANNVVSDNYSFEEFSSTGEFGQSFILTQKAAQPVRLFLPFEQNSDLTANFDSVPIGSNGDEISAGNLIINALPLGNFLTHKRNFTKSLDASAGLVAGTRFFISQITGQMGLLGFQKAPEDQPNSWLSGFFIDGNKLKLLINGISTDLDFPDLVPTVRTNITAVSGRNISVSSEEGFKVGEIVYFEQDGQVVNYGEVESIAPNLLIVKEDPLMTFTAGLKLLQQSTYLIKWVYYPGSIIFYGKPSTDTDFRILHKHALSLSGSMFFQLYANSQHAGGLDFFDLQENLEIFVTRTSPDNPSSRRNLDVSFEDSASQLQSEVQVVTNNDDNFQLKFETPPPENFFTVDTIISPTTLKLVSVENLKIGDRLLINNYERFVDSLDIPTSTITWQGFVDGLSLNTSIIKTDIFPALGQVLKVSYRTMKEEVLPLCPVNCSATKSKIPKIINLNFENQVKYSGFRELAQAELTRLCLPQLSGSFTMIIESRRSLDLGVTGLLADIPLVGEKIRIIAPRYKTDFDQLEGYVTNVVISSVGHENTFKAEITIGEKKNKFDSFLWKLNKSTKPSNLIDESLPADDLMCLFQERCNVSVQMSLSSFVFSNFRNNLHSSMINEIRTFAYTDQLILSDVAKWSAINGRSNGFINELVN